MATTPNQLRFKTKTLSVPDELYWYNNNTDWSALSRKEFRTIMIRMETITAQFYEDFGECVYPTRSATIKKFWANEWGCEYLPESGKWVNLTTGAFIESETEKKAKRDAKRAEKASSKNVKKENKPKEQVAQYNDEEEEVYVQAAQKQQQQQQQQQQQTYGYDDWFDAEEEAYAEAYANARAQEEQRQQEQLRKEQKEAQAYLDSLAYDYQSEEPEEQQQQPEQQQQQQTRIVCQPVLYFEELTNVQGDPDWRAFIYYDARIRRFVLKGTRRSLRAISRNTRYPEVKLCFRSSRELANYLRSSTDNAVNVTMFAMASATVKDAAFSELYTLPARGYKTELFGYDRTRPSYSTWVDDLCILRDVDVSHSNFAAF